MYQKSCKLKANDILAMARSTRIQCYPLVIYLDGKCTGVEGLPNAISKKWKGKSLAFLSIQCFFLTALVIIFGESKKWYTHSTQVNSSSCRTWTSFSVEKMRLLWPYPRRLSSTRFASMLQLVWVKKLRKSFDARLSTDLMKFFTSHIRFWINMNT